MNTTAIREFFRFVFFRTDCTLARIIAVICWVTAFWLLVVVHNANADTLFTTKWHERDYQAVWCNEFNGEVEVRLRDATRVDCVADIDGVAYAIEFDYAKKWAEAIGQSLYYANMLRREPGVVLIVENFDSDMKHINKITYAMQGAGIRLWLTQR